MDDDEIAARGGIPDSEWDELAPEQKLTALMMVQAAGEEPVPPEVLERAREAYKRPYAS